MSITKIYKKFTTQEDCLRYLEAIRWNGRPGCPYCNSLRVTRLAEEQRYHCNLCNTSFSVTVGTIFHKTKIDLQKWFLAISIVLNTKERISVRQLARDIGVDKNTAWLILMKIRQAIRKQSNLLRSIVEADETWVKGKNKNKHSTGLLITEKPEL